MMAEGVDAEAEMEGLFGGDDISQEQEGATQSLTQEEAEQQREGGANLDVTGTAEPVKRRVNRNPVPKLDADRLMGPRGIQTLENVFEDWKPRGKGREFEDLDLVMKKMEHWAHRLYPKFNFDGVLGVLANREGKKKSIQTHVKKIRLGMVTAPVEKVVEEVEEDEREVERYGGEEDGDEEQPDVFGELLRQAGSKNVAVPPPVQRVGGLTEEQKEKIRRNKELAEQRKREKRDREQREAEELLKREADNAALDEEEELEREMTGSGLVGSSNTVSAPAATEWDREDSSSEQMNSEVRVADASPKSKSAAKSKNTNVLDSDSDTEEMVSEALISKSKSATKSKTANALDSDSDSEEMGCEAVITKSQNLKSVEDVIGEERSTEQMDLVQTKSGDTEREADEIKDDKGIKQMESENVQSKPEDCEKVEIENQVDHGTQQMESDFVQTKSEDLKSEENDCAKSKPTEAATKGEEELINLDEMMEEMEQE